MTSARRIILFILCLSLAPVRGQHATMPSFLEKAPGSSISRSLEDAEYFEYRLGQFSVKFERCQHVKMYDDELAEDEESSTVLALEHFVVFRLCPSDSCSSCNGVYGEYVVDLQDYLETIVPYNEEQFQYMCENCNEKCNEDGGYCSGCGKICYMLDNLENEGYIDASEYMECQQLDLDNDDDDDGDGDAQVYIGPRCSYDGSSIEIALFSDENCWENYSSGEDIEDILGGKLSFHLMSGKYTNDDSGCLPCAEPGDNDDDVADADEVNEMCENIYGLAAKCESVHGLEVGFVDVNREDQDFENQVENEFMVCNFINSLMWRSYTESGEINIDAPQDEILRKMTTLQTISVAFLGLAIAGLLAYGVVLYRQIDQNYPRLELAARNSDAQIT